MERSSKPISQKTLKTFTQSKKAFALGFMKPHPENKISGCGRYFSKASFGHTGFSGTSFWFDPYKRSHYCFAYRTEHVPALKIRGLLLYVL